jgi:Raf kinase inhibitor-like YbhB/YbcL family protein
MVSLLDDDIEQQGELSISAADFADGDRMPDYVGYANENENPRLAIDGVPDAAASLVLVVDDPDAKSVVGFTFDHWLTWDIDPGIDAIPRSWTPNAEEATVGYNDFVEANYSGPSPPDEAHGYRFKLLALDSELGLPPEARKAVVDMTIAMEAGVLASTQLVGR